MTAMMNRPIPELLGRNDGQTFGEWVVKNCPPTRGIPSTSVEGRIMNVPMGTDPLSRAITAHEMVHAKISPMAHDMEKWIARERASIDAMVAVEELRVNYLASKAGFDMKVLFDGSEEATGERCVAMNMWPEAVRFAVSTAHTGGHKKFLAGVRRHNRVWASVLADIAKRAVAEMKKADKYDRLGSTRNASGEYGCDDELSPIGFVHTERIAEWVDRLSEDKPDDKNDDSEGDKSDDAEASEAPKKRGRKPVDEKSKEKSGDAVEKSRRNKPTNDYSPFIEWMPLKVEKCPHPVLLSGSLGKKRVASPTGKAPRRLHRALTDPDKRIFDRIVKGKGGVIVIDASGSMRVTPAQVKRVVESAPGATVLAYTTIDHKVVNGEAVSPNCWVLAHNGRMIDEMPYKRGAGNGVDLPALRHALAYRKRATTPFIWVSDGQVTGRGDNSNDALVVETTKFVLANRVIIKPDLESASDALRALGKGDKITTTYPSHIREVWSRVMGQRLP